MTDPAEKARDFWVAHSQRHRGVDAMHSTSRWKAYHRWTRQMLQRWTLARIRAGDTRYHRAVDLGCGIGDWTEHIAGLSDQVFACDVAPGFVTLTRERVPAAHVEHSDLRAYQLPPDLDLVHVGAVLMYLSDKDALDTLRRIRSQARPNALVVIRDYGAINLGRPVINDRSDFFSVHRRPRDLRKLAGEAYLRCVEQRVSPSIYGEVIARGTVLQWPLRALCRVATAHWVRASYTLLLRPD